MKAQTRKYRNALVAALATSSGGCIRHVTGRCKVLMAESTARRHLEELRKLGVVQKTIGRPTMYRLNVGEQSEFWR